MSTDIVQNCIRRGLFLLLFLVLLRCRRIQASEARVIFDPNGGSGAMEDLVFETGESVRLPVCTFRRTGHIFRGWATNMDNTSFEYADGALITAQSSMVLFALWEPQMYIIRCDGGGAEAGSMEEHYAIYGEPFTLPSCGFARLGWRFAGWSDGRGHILQPGESASDLHSGSTYSRLICTADQGKPENTRHSFRSTQGCVVFEQDGSLYAITLASINDSAYYAGDLSHYETALNLYSLPDGTLLKSVRGLPFDHGNGICRREDNGHFYIAEGGTLEGYPSGVMELDENLSFVREWTFPLLSHIWAITWDGEHFYVLGRNENSRNSLCVLSSSLETLSVRELDDYYAQAYSSQGIACDDTFLYCLSAGFQAYEWKSKQRINVFTHDGEYVGVWSIDIPHEAEDITILGPYAYINTNEGSKSGIYRTRLPVVTLTAIWQK